MKNRVILMEDTRKKLDRIVAVLKQSGCDHAIVADVQEIADLLVTAETIVKIDDVVIDLANRIVSRNGKRVSLKPREFDLLAMLARHMNQSLSREEILVEVWGEDYFGEEHTVDVRISALRKKLGFEKRIVTIHGYGYRLEDRQHS